MNRRTSVASPVQYLLASLLCLAAACGDDSDGDSGSGGAALDISGVDGSEERAEAVFNAYCKNALKCGQTFGQTEEECYSDLDIGWGGSGAYNEPEPCRDAMLDHRACQATAPCDKFTTACKALDDKSDEICQ